jgi:hypothetical protein
LAFHRLVRDSLVRSEDGPWPITVAVILNQAQLTLRVAITFAAATDDGESRTFEFTERMLKEPRLLTFLRRAGWTCREDEALTNRPAWANPLYVAIEVEYRTITQRAKDLLFNDNFDAASAPLRWCDGGSHYYGRRTLSRQPTD